jgi:hypothetical protein
VDDGEIDNTNTINNAINMDGRNDMMKGAIDAEVQVLNVMKGIFCRRLELVL